MYLVWPRPCSTVGSQSNCRSRDLEFANCRVPYFHGDWCLILWSFSSLGVAVRASPASLCCVINPCLVLVHPAGRPILTELKNWWLGRKESNQTKAYTGIYMYYHGNKQYEPWSDCSDLDSSCLQYWWPECTLADEKEDSGPGAQSVASPTYYLCRSRGHDLAPCRGSYFMEIDCEIISMVIHSRRAVVRLQGKVCVNH